MISKRFAWFFALLVLASLSVSAPAKQGLTLRLANDVDVDISIYPAKGDTVLLWLACNEGSEGAETSAAEILARQGIETWLPDFLSAHFLPKGPSSIYKITGVEVARVIRAISDKHPAKKIYLVAGGRANAPLIRGAATWEKNTQSKPLAGALMLYPRLNLLKPVPGTNPVYIKEVGQATLPIHILEGEHTPNRWGLPHLKNKLQQSGAKVQSELLPKVRGYFYTRADATPAEESMSKRLPELVTSALNQFERQTR